MENLEDYKLLEGEFGLDINLIDIAKKSVINSYGGDLFIGFAAYDLLSPLSDTEVGVMGVCASSGTLPLCGASHSWGTKNSKFSIHNPWAEVSGDATELRKTADELEIEQDKIVAIYVKELTIGEADIRALMEKDELFGAVKALEIGLIDEIKEDELKPIEAKTAKQAFFNLKKNKMSEISKEDLKTEFEKQENTLYEKFKNIFVSRIKNIILKDTGGIELDFDVETAEEIVEGTAVTAPDGDYILEDGRTVSVVSNAVASITAPVEDNADLDALKAENEELKAQIEAAKTVQNEAEVKIENLTTEGEAAIKDLAEFKNTWSKKVNNLAIPEDNGKEDDSKVRTAKRK
jgi:ATP-dependent protease ClpP protease subunit